MQSHLKMCRGLLYFFSFLFTGPFFAFCGRLPLLLELAHMHTQIKHEHKQMHTQIVKASSEVKA